MAYQTNLEVPELEIKQTPVVFHVWDGSDKLGRLHVSKSRIEWYPKNKRVSIKMDWAKFAEVIENANP